MKYRTLGRTGLKVSRLGFGAMRLPMKDGRIVRGQAIPMLHRALERGVNYFDTAVMYGSGDSQRVLGEALADRRDRVVLSTKNHYFGDDEGTWRRNLEESLESLRTDHIDLYHTHGVDQKSFREAVRPRVLKWMLKARDEGLIRHLATSFHDTPEALEEIIDSGLFASMTVQYNLLNRELEAMLAHAHEAGMGVVVMGPVGGGRLGVSSEVLEELLPETRRVPELALRFVLANPHVDVALSGMSEPAHIEENADIASDGTGLSAEDLAVIQQHADRLKAMADLYCTGCGYCKPCSEGVNISRVFDLLNIGRVYGLWDHARKAYANWEQRAKEGNLTAPACTQCGQCLEKCPQHIQIPDQLRDAHETLNSNR